VYLSQGLLEGEMHMGGALMTELRTPASLLRALEQAVKQPTAEELRDQGVSFVMGSVGMSSGITRADVEQALNLRGGRGSRAA
jgi:hypothetical protein